jgi:hypothetical protein
MAFSIKPGRPGLFHKEDNALRQSGPIYRQYGRGQSCPDGWINLDASPTLCLPSARLGSESSSRGAVELARSVIGRSAHLWMWDESSLAAALDKTGFVNIRRCSFGDCTDGNFRLVEDAGRFYDANDGVEECGKEAMKPEGHS